MSGVALSPAVGGLEQDRLHVGLRLLEQHDADARARVFRRERRVREPGAVHEPEQVVLRPHVLVHRGRVDARGERRGGGVGEGRAGE